MSDWTCHKWSLMVSARQVREEAREEQRRLERLEEKVNKLNAGSVRLGLAPPTAARAHGRTYELSLRRELLETRPDSLLSIDPSSVVAPAVREARAAIGRELHAFQDELIEAEALQARREEEAVTFVEQLEVMIALDCDLIAI
jgi:hypothetical protein